MAKRCVWEFEEWNWIYYNKKLVFLIKSSLYDYSDEFILVTVDIAVAGDNGTNLAFENCAPISTCKTEINNVFIDETNHFYIAMSMYNLTEYSDDYSDTSGSLCKFKRS